MESKPGRGKIRRHENRLLDLDLEGEYANIIKQNQEKSPLLRLPAEIRNQIYEYTLGFGRMFDKCCTTQCSLSTTYPAVDTAMPMKKNSLGLLRTCRQIYAEAALIPFRINTFTFRECQASFQFWQWKLRPFQLEAVASIEFWIPRVLAYTWFCELDSELITYLRSEFPGLKKIQVNIFQKDAVITGYLWEHSKDTLARQEDKVLLQKIKEVSNHKLEFTL